MRVARGASTVEQQADRMHPTLAPPLPSRVPQGAACCESRGLLCSKAEERGLGSWLAAGTNGQTLGGINNRNLFSHGSGSWKSLEV